MACSRAQLARRRAGRRVLRSLSSRDSNTHALMRNATAENRILCALCDRNDTLFTSICPAFAEEQMEGGQWTKLNELVLHEPRLAQGQLFHQDTRLFD